MSKPIDPGVGKSKEEAISLRKAEWKRPTKKPDRDKLRSDRVTEARAVMPK